MKTKKAARPRFESIFELTERDVKMALDIMPVVYKRGVFYQGVDNAYGAARDLMWRFCASVRIHKDIPRAIQDLKKVFTFAELAEQGLAFGGKAGRPENYYVFVSRALPLIAALTILKSDGPRLFAEIFMKDAAYLSERFEAWEICAVRKYCATFLDDSDSLAIQMQGILESTHPDQALPRWRQEYWNYDHLMVAILERNSELFAKAIEVCSANFRKRAHFRIEFEEHPVEGLGPTDNQYVFDWLALAFCFMASDKGMRVSFESDEIPYQSISTYLGFQGRH